MKYVISRKEYMDNMVYSKVGRLSIKTSEQIHNEVLNDWGSISLRHVKRLIKGLKDRGKIKAVTDLGIKQGYLRTGK